MKQSEMFSILSRPFNLIYIVSFACSISYCFHTMISNNEIFERLRDLGLNPPIINEANRMYGLALIYNNEIDKSVNEYELQIDSQQVLECSLNNDQRRKDHTTQVPLLISLFAFSNFSEKYISTKLDGLYSKYKIGIDTAFVT